MKYLIQNRTTREYFQHGRWTLESHGAQEYSDVGQAMMACLLHHLDDVDLVLHFGGEMGRNCSLQLSLPAQLGVTARANC